MMWLAIQPGELVAETLQLYNFTDMEFRVLLLALAALNFFVCFIFEVSPDTWSHMSYIRAIENSYNVGVLGRLSFFF